ncbi:MAG TPA: TIGR00730 family Rossman fold protein [Steroidobacter sp.]|uniref:LOG family protein n=1 Tax=Steroidobacter sp. TaxID=1978227 RepID=UPI002ED8C38A
MPVNPSDAVVERAALAYLNREFMESEAGRPIRILSEYLAPLRALRDADIHDTVVFFGSARITQAGPLQRYYEEARELAGKVTRWSQSISRHRCCLVVCTGGSGGIMEAANRGAAEAGGRSVGFNIGLPAEQRPNAYVDKELTFQFHYFFMRKLWFAHLARAIVVFPGGFGTMDELFEILTLKQTRKLGRSICIVLYGSSYWREILNLEALAKHGTISRTDLDLFHYADDPETALQILKDNVQIDVNAPSPDLARSSTPCPEE